ncbi:glycosyl transferase [Rugosimonospora africana]|uniref:Glycosyl transferase n=1 Tax=Rugosimonospora africana TaxID=556532 RepID=A0A8J3QM13_9ACTN|nr:glycosyl transferase [Rugosimonospora africana]
MVFLLGALETTAHLWRDVSGRLLASNHGDHTLFEWMLARGALLVTHPENPFFTHRMNVPAGVNMMANTSALSMTIPLAPVTLIWGPVVAFAVMLTLALWLTALAWYYVFSRHLVESRFGAFVGAGLCGFAPAMVAHASGQPNLVAQFAIPFMALATLRLAGRPVRRGILLGLLITYQAFLNEEVLFLAGLAIGAFVVLYALFDRQRARREVRRFLIGLGVAALTGGVLLAYPVYWQFFGPHAYHGLPFPPGSYQLDAVAYVTYARESVGGRVAAPALGQSPNEDNASFGWPLVALAVVVTVYLWRRSALVRAGAVTALIFAVLSLGPKIEIGNHHTGVPGPYRLLLYVPLVDLSVPGRYAFAVIVVLGMLLALGIQRVLDLTSGSRRTRLHWAPLWLIVLLGALIPVLPTPIPTVGRAPVPGFIASGQWRGYVPEGRTIVSVPLPAYRFPDPMLWQASTRLAYQIPRGYFLGPSGTTNRAARFGAPPRPTATKLYAVYLLPYQPSPYVGGDTPLGTVVKPRDPEAARARATTVTAADRRNALADLRYWRAAVVILAPGRNEALLSRTTSALLGFQPTWVNGVWLWDVRKIVGG